MRLSLNLSHLTASTAMCWSLLRHLRRRGVPTGDMLDTTGLHLGEILVPGNRMQLTDLWRLWRTAAGALQDDDDALGVLVACDLDPLAPQSWSMPFALFEGLMWSAETLHNGIEHQQPFLRLLRDGFALNIEKWHGSKCLVSWEFDFPHAEPRPLVDFQVGVWIMLARRALGLEVAMPVDGWFARPAPRDPAPYHALFGPNLRFAAPYDGLVVDASVMHRALPTSDAWELHFFQHQGRSLMEPLPVPGDFAAHVREAIAAGLPSGRVTADHIAGRLDISTRTLHRHLRARGTTYQTLLDQVRYKLATKYLQSGQLSLRQVSAQLGFACQSSFQRAFKARTGHTPGEYSLGERLTPPPPKPRRRAELTADKFQQHLAQVRRSR